MKSVLFRLIFVYHQCGVQLRCSIQEVFLVSNSSVQFRSLIRPNFSDLLPSVLPSPTFLIRSLWLCTLARLPATTLSEIRISSSVLDTVFDAVKTHYEAWIFFLHKHFAATCQGREGQDNKEKARDHL